MKRNFAIFALILILAVSLSSCGFSFARPLDELSGEQLPDVIVMDSQ